MTAVDQADTWFAQAASDLRTAEALLGTPSPMLAADVGCHVAALCAQAVEKSIKGYVILNGATPKLGHRPDKYLPMLLTKNDPLLRHRDHHRHLSKLFDPSTTAAVGDLLDLTPGGLGSRTDVPNTEYPWKVAGSWKHVPARAPEFGDSTALAQWLKLARRVHDSLKKLVVAAGRGVTL